MANLENRKDGIFHNLIHRLFQNGTDGISIQVPDDYRFETVFDYRTFSNNVFFSDDDIERVRVVIESWAEADVRFARVKRSEGGFRVTVYSNLPNGRRLGNDLFRLLAKRVFREIDKGAAYNLLAD